MATGVLPSDSAEALAVKGGRPSVDPNNVDAWARPSDWLAMPAVLSTDNKFVGLLAVTNDAGNYVALSATGAYTVDWGDGSAAQNFASGVTAVKQYTYSSISSTTESSRGYRQVLVTVTPQAGQTFSSINLQKKHTLTGLNSYNTRWLDIVVAGSSLTSIVISAATRVTSLYNLEQVKILSSAVTSYASLFESCYKLESILINSSGIVTSTVSMFENCYSLQSVPLFNTASVTDMSYMFAYSNLDSVPSFKTSSVLNMTGMFSGLYKLKKAPMLNTSLVTNMYYMFSDCFSLESVPLFNTSSVTNMSNMFYSCYSLQSVPLFNTASVTDMSGMFANCYNLKSFAGFNLASVTDMSYMFDSCYSLKSFNVSNVALGTFDLKMFKNCRSLVSVVGLAGDSSFVFNSDGSTGYYYDCSNLSELVVSNIQTQLDLSFCAFSSTSLNYIIDNLNNNVGNLSFDITGNWGASYNLLSGSSTSGSKTVTTSSTSGLSVGDEIYNVAGDITVTLQDTGDTVTKSAHGLPNGTLISFTSIVTTTGLNLYTPYYVVNATTNTFQVSDTIGGSAKPLTTNGSGTCIYGATITAINPNVSVTLSTPLTFTGATTLDFGKVRVTKARLKGWTVSYG